MVLITKSWWLDTYRWKADPLHGWPKHHMPARIGEEREGGGRAKKKKKKERNEGEKRKACKISGRGKGKLCEEKGSSNPLWSVKERLSVECLLAGNLFHWFWCHIVVTWRSVYVLAGGIKVEKSWNVRDCLTTSWIFVIAAVVCWVASPMKLLLISSPASLLPSCKVTATTPLPNIPDNNAKMWLLKKCDETRRCQETGVNISVC